MGLDMYAYSVARSRVEANNGIVVKMDNTKNLYYWRKFNALHGWMEKIFRERGGEGEFNCVGIVITEDDLKRLEEDAASGKLQPYAGFFFGAMEVYPEDLNTIKDFAAKAREEFKDDRVVVYDSWW